MQKRTRLGVALAIAIGFGLPGAPAAGALPTACKVLPGSQVARIFGTPVTTTASSDMGADARSSVCRYVGATTLAVVQFVYAASPEAATTWEKQMSAARSPMIKVGRKGNTVVLVQSFKPSDSSKLSALFDAAMRKV